MANYDKARISDEEEFVGKTIKRHIIGDEYIFQEYDDGSFFYGEYSHACEYIDSDAWIMEGEAVELGIATREAAERFDRQNAVIRAEVAEQRRREYEAMKKEFEGDSP